MYLPALVTVPTDRTNMPASGLDYFFFYQQSDIVSCYIVNMPFLTCSTPTKDNVISDSEAGAVYVPVQL